MNDFFQVVFMAFGIAMCYITAFILVYLWDKYTK
jgi:hypothetical protein